MNSTGAIDDKSKIGSKQKGYVCFEKDVLKVYSLSCSVITCKEAASAKKIPLKNELKSLVLTTSNGLYLLHLPGDKKANLRTVKCL